MKEDDLLNWIYARSRSDDPKVAVGPGDDMAVVNSPHRTTLITVDQVLDGVHIDLARHGPRSAGRKAMARNLSDVAAMAARPVAAVASVALPEEFPQTDAEEIYHGLRELADGFDCPLVGGDVAVWTRNDQPLQISVTVIACPAGATGGIEPVRRDGARGGQAIFVTGSLGGAWRTQRHLTFIPRVREAIVLALRYKLRSMIDISDGLAKDLGRLCKASGCGAELIAEAIPLHPDAAAGRDVDPLSAALYDGEDYELLFTVPSAQADRLLHDDKIPVPVARIGTVTKQPGLTLIAPDGTSRPLPPDGWEHGKAI